MTIAATSLTQAPIAAGPGAGAKVPLKRRTTATSEPALVPEAR
jgi:hypothetical protein